MLANLRLQRVLLAIRNDGRVYGTAAFKDASHNSLVLRPPGRSLRLPLIGVHVARLTAHEGLVGFNLAGKLVERARMHGVANPLQHEPSASLCDLNVSSDLIGTDAVLAVGN